MLTAIKTFFYSIDTLRFYWWMRLSYMLILKCLFTICKLKWWTFESSEKKKSHIHTHSPTHLRISKFSQRKMREKKLNAILLNMYGTKIHWCVFFSRWQFVFSVTSVLVFCLTSINHLTWTSTILKTNLLFVPHSLIMPNEKPPENWKPHKNIPESAINSTLSMIYALSKRDS